MKVSRTEKLLPIGLLCLLATGCGGGRESLTVPPGTEFVVALATTSRSDWVEPGETLVATMDEDVAVDGAVVVPRGSAVSLAVLDAQVADEQGPARLQLELRSIDLADGDLPIESEPLDIVGRQEPTESLDTSSLGTGYDSQAGSSPRAGATLKATDGTTSVLAIDQDAIVLPAGQRLVFVTSREFELQRLDLASANES